MRNPQKFEIFAKDGDLVEIQNIDTGERVTMPNRHGRQIHCPRPDFDLLLNGVKQEPCDNSIIF